MAGTNDAGGRASGAGEVGNRLTLDHAKVNDVHGDVTAHSAAVSEGTFNSVAPALYRATFEGCAGRVTPCRYARSAGETQYVDGCLSEVSPSPIVVAQFAVNIIAPTLDATVA